jgi:hypothetical protein
LSSYMEMVPDTQSLQYILAVVISLSPGPEWSGGWGGGLSRCWVGVNSWLTNTQKLGGRMGHGGRAARWQVKLDRGSGESESSVMPP